MDAGGRVSKVSSFHRNSFRPQTEKKLRILRKYMGPWLDLWSAYARSSHWYVIDLFAGSGVSGGHFGSISGSPLVYLEEIQARREKLAAAGREIHLVLIEADPVFFAALKERTNAFVAEHQLQDLVHLHQFEGDCNLLVPHVLANLQHVDGAPALAFIDPCNIDVHRSTVEALLDAPWREDVLMNYMLSAVKRDVGCATAGNRGWDSATERLLRYFGQNDAPGTQGAAEDASTYARPIFCARGHKVAVFHMQYPGRKADQYYLMFASKNGTVSTKIVPEIFAKEYTDRYGQGTLLGADDFLDGMQVIE